MKAATLALVSDDKSSLRLINRKYGKWRLQWQFFYGYLAK